MEEINGSENSQRKREKKKKNGGIFAIRNKIELIGRKYPYIEASSI